MIGRDERNPEDGDYNLVGLKIMQFLALLFTALALVPGGAHLFELPAKMALTQEQYVGAQQLYRGWAWLGAFLLLAIVTNAVLTMMLRRRQLAFQFAAIAFFLSVCALAIFFAWTYPVNIATDNWTVAPADWESLRVRWEYSHAAGAIVMLGALCAQILSVLRVETVARDLNPSR